MFYESLFAIVSLGVIIIIRKVSEKKKNEINIKLKMKGGEYYWDDGKYYLEPNNIYISI